ncbi:hypothetical protein ERO13_D08G190233v2 [Gossypium hirsutum]|uniref:Uncharacterized protein n=3 Tax=Gossypium TaxID=3633 RepID=A0A5J5QGX0_GOSBA|nr:hypothetical protein ES319_D08G207600v1 [Gossypium barbadense]KAG4135024.1 hypothetical protein ERO13_D08G190233v2 [Gossypium hirsutum]TYG58393.1 hypothetical protein ES288_D08G218600v1 [Gossypium darwinii]TYH59347.1 hypothetical protein ES332_D08G216000v1 [Gossypium tomentosum]
MHDWNVMLLMNVPIYWLLKSLVWRRRKKMSSLEKERQDFLSTIEALKEAHSFDRIIWKPCCKRRTFRLI